MQNEKNASAKRWFAQFTKFMLILILHPILAYVVAISLSGIQVTAAPLSEHVLLAIWVAPPLTVLFYLGWSTVRWVRSKSAIWWPILLAGPIIAVLVWLFDWVHYIYVLGRG